MVSFWILTTVLFEQAERNTMKRVSDQVNHQVLQDGGVLEDLGSCFNNGDDDTQFVFDIVPIPSRSVIFIDKHG